MKPDLQKKLILPLIVLVISSIIIVILVILRPDPPKKHKKTTEYGVLVIDAVKGDFQPYIPLYGFVESPMNAQITAAISSDVEKVIVSEGDFVEKGQLLIQLDQIDYQLNLHDREADLTDIIAQIKTEQLQYENNKEAILHEKSLLELAKGELKRATKLYIKKLGSESSLEQAKSSVEKQELSYNSRKLALDLYDLRLQQLQAKKMRGEAAVERAKRDLARASILAPFSGRVASVYVANGDRVSPGAKIISVYSLEQLEVRADINSVDITTIRTELAQGNLLSAYGAIEGESIKLQLDRLSGKTEKGRTGVAGLFKITDGGDRLTLGRFIEFGLELPQVSDLFSIPLQAIYGKQRIYTAKDGVMQLINIDKVGQHKLPSGEVRALVKSEQLSQGDKIIVTQIPNAIQGLRIKIISSSEQ